MQSLHNSVILRQTTANIRLTAYLLLLSLIVIGTTHAQGLQQVLTMKTGLQYEGELKGATAVIEGSSVYSTYGSENLAVIDDGLRFIFVSQNRTIAVGDSNRNEIEIPILQRPQPGDDKGTGSIVSIGQFNEQGHRNLVIIPPTGGDPLAYVQGITKIHPRYCEVKTLVGAENRPVQWSMKIATGTVPTNVLRNLLRTQIGDPNSATEHLAVADLFIQAQQFPQALEELRLIQQKFPDLSERIADERQLLQQAYARQILREVRLRLDAGQNEVAVGLAKAFPKEGLAGEILAEFSDLIDSVSRTATELAAAREKVNELIGGANDLQPQQANAVKRFRDELETDLNEHNVGRLDSWLRLADDATMPPQQKLALAISGWLLGSNKAIEKLAIVEDMYSVRDLVREYLTSADVAQRERILSDIKAFEAGTPEYLSAMIAQMKPIDAFDLKQPGQEYTGERPIEFDVEVPGPVQNPTPYKFQCLVHLPPSYDPYRQYPLLIALPGASQTAEQHLNMWCGTYSPKLEMRVGHAGRNGTIVMAVEWKSPGQNIYSYSAREHAAVLKAMRTALRKFSIDTDRVFLSGHGIGGEAAYDIGLSHPEHWAGVISVSGAMAKYQRLYRKNRHTDLAVLSVVGSKDYSNIRASNDAWNDWLPSRHFLDSTVVLYQGRGNELFVEEIPETLRWMGAQRRRVPDKSGWSFDVRALRPWDCYFWFVEFDGIPVDQVIWPEDYRSTNIPRLRLSGSYRGDTPNQFRIGPDNPKSVNAATLWLSPDYVNFDELIYIKGLGNDFKDNVKPSIRVLLEDVRRRAERKHPFWGRVDLKGYDWVAVE